MSRKTVVITGGSSEGAQAAAVAAAKAGANVVLLSRSVQRGEAARDEVIKRSRSNEVHLIVGDLALRSSAREIARQLTGAFPAIAALIHHGVYHQLRKQTRELTEDGVERFWAYNHIGPFRLTHLLKDALIKGKGRVLVVGSTRLKVYPRLQVYLDDPEFTTRSFSPTRAFYQAKLAQLQFALAFERHWAGTGVIAKALCVPALGVDPSRRSELPWYRRLAHVVPGGSGLTLQKLGELYTVAALSPAVAKIPAVHVDHRLLEAWAPIAAFDVKQQDALWALSMRALAD